MALLNDLTPSQMQAALNEFDDAMKSKAGKVRNSQAYLVGVIKRYLHVNKKERSSAGAPPMGKDITPVVKVSYIVVLLSFVTYITTLLHSFGKKNTQLF